MQALLVAPTSPWCLGHRRPTAADLHTEAAASGTDNTADAEGVTHSSVMAAATECVVECDEKGKSRGPTE